MKKLHLWLMLLCCPIAVVGLIAAYFFKAPVSSVLLYGMLLLCPISHVLMMGFMGRDHARDAGEHAHQSPAAAGEQHQHSPGLMKQLRSER